LNLENLTVEGQRFEPKGNQNFTRVKIYPSETANVSLGGGKKRLKGFTQVDVFVNRISGLTLAASTAEAIVAAFPTGSSALSSNQIVVYSSWIESTREEPTYLHIPVFIRWEAYS
jgi:hypothetical protein